MHKKCIFLVSFLIFFITNVFSQNNNFRTYSIEDGLSQSKIYCLMQDSRGYLWAGTDGGGLSVFDGLKFTTYNKKKGIIGNVVRALFQDKDENIWIGTDEGITIYDGYNFINLNEKQGLPKGTVLKIFQDKENTIWLATDNGLVKILSKQNKFFVDRIYTTKDGLVTNFIFDIYQQKNGDLWLALYGGINVISFTKDTFSIKLFNKQNLLPSSIITSIQGDENDNLWIGTYDTGFFKLNPNKVSEITNIFLPNHTVWDILRDKNNDLWLCTDKSGVYKYSNGKLINYSTKQGFPNNQVLSVIEDNEQNLWFGTMGSGLVKHMGEHFSHYLKGEDFLNNEVTSISKDADGFVFSTYGEGIVKINDLSNTNNIIQITKDNGLLDNNINDVFVSEENVLWVSTQSGLNVVSGEQIINVTEENGLPDNRINCTFIDSKGIVWIGTGAGLSIYNKGEFLNVTKENEYELPDDDIQTIIEDKNESVWIGTLGGLLKFSKGEMTSFDEHEGLLDKSIHSLLTDKQGNIWIGTFGGGLYFYDALTNDSIKIKHILNSERLLSNNIYSLIFENDSSLIVGSDKGFDKISFGGKYSIKNIKSYTIQNGFVGVENKLNAIYKDNNGDIYFGTIKGLTKYSSSKEKINSALPLINLEGIDLFYELTYWGKSKDSINRWFSVPLSLELDHNKNKLTFRFNATSLTNPEKVEYTFILEGLDEKWSPAKRNTEAIYSGLPDGDYIFKVKARNENGVWSKPIEYSFIINPPFWKTTWFISLAIIFIILNLGLFIKWREQKLKQEKAILEEKVEERTIEIAEKNQILEQANEEILTQRDEIEAQRDTVLEQKDRIEEIHTELKSSIHYAERIQKAVLPTNEFLKNNLPNHFVLFKPHSVVSGDFYWAIKKDNKIIITAADCTGHGVHGAFMSMLGISFLNEIASKPEITESSEILNELRLNVINALKQKGVSGEQKDGMDMALCVIDLETNIIQFSGANNPLYIITNSELQILNDESIPFVKRYDSSELNIQNSKILYEIKPNKMPIAIYEKMDDFINHEIHLQKGDVIYMFSDGYADQFGGPKGKKFKYKPFKRLLLENADKPMEKQKEILETSFEEWKAYPSPDGEKFGQIDDVVVLGIRM